MSIPPLPFPSPDDSFSNTIPPNVEYIPNDPIAANNPNSNPPDVPLPIPTSSDDVHDNTSNSFPNDPNVNVGYSDEIESKSGKVQVLPPETVVPATETDKERKYDEDNGFAVHAADGNYVGFAPYLGNGCRRGIAPYPANDGRREYAPHLRHGDRGQHGTYFRHSDGNRFGPYSGHGNDRRFGGYPVHFNGGAHGTHLWHGNGAGYDVYSMNGNIGGYGIHSLHGNCGKYGGRIGYVDGIGYGRMIKYGGVPAYGSGSMNIDRGGHLNGAVFDGCGAFSIGAAYDARGSFINRAVYNDRGGNNNNQMRERMDKDGGGAQKGGYAASVATVKTAAATRYSPKSKKSSKSIKIEHLIEHTEYAPSIISPAVIDGSEYKKGAKDYKGEWIFAQETPQDEWECIMDECDDKDDFDHGPTWHWNKYHALPHEYRWECDICCRRFRYKFSATKHIQKYHTK